MWRGSWGFLSQVRRSSNVPRLSSLPSAHLGLQRLRLLGPTLNGSCAPSFSAAAEAASMANSAEPEAISSVDRAETEMPSTDDRLAASASTTPLKVDGEQGESALIKIVEEHRQHVSTLKAELEEHKTLARSILDEIRVLKLKDDRKSAEIKPPPEKKVPLLGWTAFLEHLQDSGYFKDGRRAPLANGASSIFEDLECVKTTIHKFSQAHDSIFESLSQIDLRIVARYGCALNDSDAAASQKRLRQHFHLEDSLTEDSSDKSANTQPKLSDVTRLLHFSIVDGTLEEDVRLSISHLLREIITLSRKSREASPHALHRSLLDKTESATPEKVIKSSKPDKVKVVKEETIDVKKIDTPLGEGSTNTGKAEARLETTAPSAHQWKCPRCSFMNLDTKDRCVECSRRRPQRTYAVDSAKICDDASLVEDTEQEVNKAKDKKGSMVSSSAQGRGNFKGSTSLASCDTESDQSSSDDDDKNTEEKDPFDVLDDILESKDSDEDESSAEESKEKTRGSGKKAYSRALDEDEESVDESKEKTRGSGKKAYSRASDEDEESVDESKEKTRGSGKKASSLAGLFIRQPKWEGERRNNSRPPERRPSRGGFPKSRDSNRRLGSDEDESSSNEIDMPSRKGVDYQDDEGYGRRSGRERYNNTRGGGGGGRGYRGDSYDDRRRDRGPRGGRDYGDRDRGSRSDSYGGRSERGRGLSQCEEF
ncbi:hypothetical protein GOP47_0008811 [Adiantum capillus-veneris]|uniref:RanBP2-type domain-containing protein n=1 Tax=Adiantum capillus-veneris TaxID=13818 RepID=A0A9D4UZK7_ADICA|nr:hypothetical protein GOP47_0008811 [Adiantum capillus-veneris]